MYTCIGTPSQLNEGFALFPFQIAMASKSLKTFISETCEAGVHPMYILAGDFNTSPPYPGYHLMMDGRLSREDVHTLRTFPLPDLPSTKNGVSEI